MQAMPHSVSLISTGAMSLGFALMLGFVAVRLKAVCWRA